MSEGGPQVLRAAAAEEVAALRKEGFVEAPFLWKSAALRVLPEPVLLRRGPNPSAAAAYKWAPDWSHPWVRWHDGIPFSFVLRIAAERAGRYERSGLFMNGVWRSPSLRWCLEHPDVVAGRYAMERIR